MATSNPHPANSPTTTTTTTCPRCFHPPRSDPGETYCPNCGLVIEQDKIDRGPDWRSYESDDHNPSRCSPGNPNHPDRGLGSTHDSFGPGIDARRQDRIDQHATSRKKDRNRGYATSEIHRVTVTLDLPEFVRARAKHLFRRLHDAVSLEGRDLDAVAGACVYLSVREDQMGRTADDIAGVARADARPIRRRTWWIASELSLEVPPPCVRARVRVVAGRLDATREQTERALAYLDGLDSDEQGRGSPSVVAAAALYESCEAWSQREVAEAGDVTPAGVRDRRRKLA